MRINKYIASCGEASRRKADELIRAGRVLVNGRVLTEPGYDVRPEDEVTVDGRVLRQETKKVYYMLNKPIGVITSVSDDQGRMTVLDLIDQPGQRLFPVGRLDYNTSGLLFLTNDGDFAYHLTHPKNEVEKTYRVRIAGNISRQSVARLRQGVEIGRGIVTQRAYVKVLSWTKHSTLLEVRIHEGRNREVRRMFEAVGKPVQELTRTAVGKITLGRLREGQYRKLSPAEVDYLMKL
ncbi:MAG: pseudouridine synthase [Anaerovoracaceae bacterium]|jgi:23S rRNA pseudouridine2605 synthase